MGTAKSVTFDVTADLGQYGRAQLVVDGEDIDEPAEASLKINGNEGPIPATVLSGAGRRAGMIDIPLSALKQGANATVFTFESNLGGTTTGYRLLQAALVLTKKQHVAWACLYHG